MLIVVDLFRTGGLVVEAVGVAAAATAVGLLVLAARGARSARDRLERRSPDVRLTAGRSHADQPAAPSGGGGCIAAPGIVRGEGRRAGFFSGVSATGGTTGATSSGKTVETSSPASRRSN